MEGEGDHAVTSYYCECDDTPRAALAFHELNGALFCTWCRTEAIKERLDYVPPVPPSSIVAAPAVTRGPTLKTVSYLSCSGCEFHRRRPEDELPAVVASYRCTNPAVLAKFVGTSTGVYLGSNDKTPEYCPLIQG